MKKLSLLKTFQLTVMILLSFGAIYCLLNGELKAYIFESRNATLLFLLVWAVLIVNFIFILLDYITISGIKVESHQLYEAAYADALSGMPNRFSCDVLIEKYAAMELPANVGCMMLELTNLPEINALHGHAAGNQAVQQFSKILTSAALSSCFVGRNGGNKFLAIFENCGEYTMDDFLLRVNERLDKYLEKNKTIEIKYKAGIAKNSAEHTTSITKLISMANGRIYDSDSANESNAVSHNGNEHDETENDHTYNLDSTEMENPHE